MRLKTSTIWMLPIFLGCHQLHAQPPEIRQWLESPQQWQRDADGPIISLGEKGQFDDTHVFAPMVALTDNHFQLWYCGSTSSVAQRVFQLGLATSGDGINFKKQQDNPVYSFGDGTHSILTPTLLRNGDGSALRENEKLRMWFSSTWFEGDDYFLTMRILVETYIPHEPPPYELEDAIMVPEDSHLLILMADGSIARLPVREPYSVNATFLRPNADGNSSKNDFWKSTEAHISYVLDEEMMSVLTSQDATNMRIEAGDTYYDIGIQKKSRGDMAEVIGCIQQAHATEGSIK